jgi:molybdopterin converting factor small subunit
LFAQAREAAGRGSDELAGATVGEVLQSARLRYGEAFARVLDSSAVWLNGEAAQLSDAVADVDEVAVLPPVSGGG